MECLRRRCKNGINAWTYGASIMVTGGTAGFALAALDVGLVAYESVNRYDQAQQSKNEYIAGVGDVGALSAGKRNVRQILPRLSN